MSLDSVNRGHTKYCFWSACLSLSVRLSVPVCPSIRLSVILQTLKLFRTFRLYKMQGSDLVCILFR